MTHPRYQVVITEAMFQIAILHLARTCGGWLVYHTRNSQGSNAGWPDLVLLDQVNNRLHVRELKAYNRRGVLGIVTPAQAEWLAGLAAAGVDAGTWTPDDWPEIEDLLTRGRAIR